MIGIKHERKTGPSTGIIMVLLGVVLGMGVIFTGSMPVSAESGQPRMTAPAMDGAMLLETRCSTCHSVAKVKNKTMTPQGWERSVTNMMNKGAKLSDAEKAALVEYLGTTYPKTK